MGFTKVLAKHSNKTVRIDTYQRLLLTQIDSYGQGSWKNGLSLHHKYDQRGAFANILIDGTVVGKVVYDVAQDDIQQMTTEQSILTKQNFQLFLISHLLKMQITI